MSEERRERRGYGQGYGQRLGGYGERRGFGGPRRGFPPKPVEVGKEYDVEIQETSRRGEGIARIKGLVCFVPNTKPGDKVKIRITRVSRRAAEAEVVGKSEGPTEATEEETEEAAEETQSTEEAAEETQSTEEAAEETQSTEEAAEETQSTEEAAEEETEETEETE
jgi:predicted RNA-binding protein with TRAM domain